MCGRYPTRPHASIATQYLLHESWHERADFVCHVGKLACVACEGLRPHAVFLPMSAFVTRGVRWNCRRARTPRTTSVPHLPRLPSCHVFCRLHGNCPVRDCKQMATLFYPEHVIVATSVFVALHGNCLVLVGGNS